jgi:hypothetical protein
MDMLRLARTGDYVRPFDDSFQLPPAKVGTFAAFLVAKGYPELRHTRQRGQPKTGANIVLKGSGPVRNDKNPTSMRFKIFCTPSECPLLEWASGNIPRWEDAAPGTYRFCPDSDFVDMLEEMGYVIDTGEVQFPDNENNKPFVAELRRTLDALDMAAYGMRGSDPGSSLSAFDQAMRQATTGVISPPEGIVLPATPRQKPKKGVVYFMFDFSKWISKIGETANLVKRSSQARTYRAGNVCYAHVPGDRFVEKFFQRKLSAHRVLDPDGGKELFGMDATLAFVKSLYAGLYADLIREYDPAWLPSRP